jgi:hypothetical protein
VPLESQQPSGHVVALQAGTKVQYDPGWLHSRPEARQSLHCAAPAPQVLSALPGKHSGPMIGETVLQQPPHVEGPQG